jgi:hypothetical protein
MYTSFEQESTQLDRGFQVQENTSHLVLFLKTSDKHTISLPPRGSKSFLDTAKIQISLTLIRQKYILGKLHKKT